MNGAGDGRGHGGGELITGRPAGNPVSRGQAGGRRVLAVRFDVDSVTCLERGIPALMRLGERRGVRFTFFVNMGRSFSWRHTVVRRLRGARQAGRAVAESRPIKMSAALKLGRRGVAETLLLNPRLGRRYRLTFDALAAAGHELGLHGGSNHAVWQYALDALAVKGLEKHVRGAFDEFRGRYGAPRGFASPGFRYNDAVLDLLDREGFEYASDMPGELPFRPLRTGTRSRHAHFQLPVNVIGEQNVPVIEQGLARGLSRRSIVRGAVERIRERDFALMYGHPCVEGVHWPVLDDILEAVRGDYDLVTASEYLRRWKETNGG